MKPWEETWTWSLESSAGYDCMTDAYVVQSPTTCERFAIDAGRRGANPEAEALVRLLAAAPAMARLLLDLQWAAGGTWGPSGDDCAHGNYACPICDGLRELRVVGRGEHRRREESGHAPDCELVAVLRAAGVVE